MTRRQAILSIDSTLCAMILMNGTIVVISNYFLHECEIPLLYKVIGLIGWIWCTDLMIIRLFWDPDEPDLSREPSE